MSEITFQSSRLPSALQAQNQPNSQDQPNIGTTANSRSVISIADVKQKILTDIEHQVSNNIAPEDKKALISAVIKDLEKTYLTNSNNNPKDPTAWEWNDWKDALYNQQSKTTEGKKNYPIDKSNQKQILEITRILSKALTEDQFYEVAEGLNKTEDNFHITPTDLYSYKTSSSGKFMKLFKIFDKFNQMNTPINKFIEAAIKQGLIEETTINQIFSSVQKTSD
jgi:hypothetical protein